MEFSLGRDTLPSQARSVRGESRRLRRERDNAKKLLSRCLVSRCLVRRVAQRDRAVAIMRPVFSATGEPPLTLSLVMITCQGTTQAQNRTSTFRYRPRHEHITAAATCCGANEQSPPRASVCLRSRLRCPLPLCAPRGRSGTDHFHGRARSRLTDNPQQPQPRRHHSNQAITEMNMCDDVSVNMSLFGNERKTPSIRSRTASEVDNSL
jgi:hypothetical protein